MAPPNGLTRFSGNEDEDASLWLEAFVISTSTFTDEAVLRMFPIFLSPDSPAQEWYYGLPENSILTWSAVERKFRQKWISRAGGQAKKESEETAAEKFRSHRLTDEDVFGRTSVDLVAMNKIVVDWADAHTQLGAVAQLDDATLIQDTISHLPTFLRAFIKCQSSPPTTFQMLCTRIKEITDEVLEFEWFHRQETNVDWQAKILEGLSERTKLNEVEEDETNSFLLPEQWKNTKVSINKAGMIEIVKELISAICKYKSSNISGCAAAMINIGLLRYYDAIKVPVQFRSTTVIGGDFTDDAEETNLWHRLFELHQKQVFSGLGDTANAISQWKSLSDQPKNYFLESGCIYKSHHTHYKGSSSEVPLKDDLKKHYGAYIEFVFARVFNEWKIVTSKTVLYVLLSAYLAEHDTAGSSAYKQAAIASANWIKTFALDKNHLLVANYEWNMYSDSRKGSDALHVALTGLFIEGLCVLGAVTGEQKWSSLATDMCDAAMVHRDWHDDNGVFNYVSGSNTFSATDIKTFRGLLTRGFLVAYQRNPTNKRLRHTIRAYISMQFNALRDTALSRGSYAIIGSGPHSIHYIQGEVAALEVLMAAVIVNHC